MKFFIFCSFLLFNFTSLASSPALNSIIIPISEIGDLNPLRGNAIYRNKILNQVLENLITLDESLSPIPQLASRWKINSKEKLIRFWLDKKKSFSDLTKVETDDIYKVFIAAKDQANGLTSQIKGFNKCSLEKKCNSFIKHSKTSFSIKLGDNNLSLFLKKLASINGVIYKKGLKKNEYVGTGPYYFSEIKEDQVLLLNRNGSQKVVFKIIKQENGLILFLKNKLSVIDNQQFNIENARLQSYPFQRKVAGTYSLILNTRFGLLKNKDIRRALYQAIDVKKITPFLGSGFIPASGLIPQGFIGHEKIKRESNIKVAKAIIGNKYKDKTLKFPLSKKSKSNLELQNYLKTLFKELGFKLKLSFVTFRERIDGFKAGKYDMMIRGDSPSYYDSGKIFISLISWDFQNISGFKNSELDSLFRLHEKQTDLTQSKKTLLFMENIIKDEVPLVPLSYPVFTEYYQKNTEKIDRTQLSIKFWDYPYNRLL